MSIRSILLSALALVAVVAVAFVVNPEIKGNQYYTKRLAEKSEKEAAEVLGSMKFFQEMRANPVTGNIEPADVEAAWNQVRINNQRSNKTTALNMFEWEPRGPDNIGGRTRGLLVDKDDPNVMYMGQTSGGFWKSTNGGTQWNRMAGMDSASRMSVTCITQAANGDIYYGTGESFASIPVDQGGGIPGGGIFKSTDKGVTSTLLPATAPPFNSNNNTWTYINRLAADPNDANHIYAAVNRGFYETKDGGTTWAKVVTPAIPFNDITISTDGSVILASSGNQMYLSTDGGANFAVGINSASRGLPGASGIGRIEVAIAPSDNNIMYCFMVNSATRDTKGCYKSIDKGQTWTTLRLGGSQVWNPAGTQGLYDIALNVHPTNPDLIFVGGQLELWRCNNTAWDVIGFWSAPKVSGLYVHADMHDIVFNNANPDEMYVVTDGGFFETDDCTIPMPIFAEKNKNYATAQCYGVAANVLGHIIFGAQDNGTNIIDGRFANSPMRANEALGGDGMRGAVSDIDPNVYYGTSQNGVLRYAVDGGGGPASFASAFDNNIDNDDNDLPDEGGPWVSPVTLEENDAGSASKSVLFIGLNDNVWFTQQAIGTGVKIWFPLITKGNARFSAISLSKNGKTAYVGTPGGILYRITGIDMFDTEYVYDDTSSNSGTFSMDTVFTITQMPSPWGGTHITDLECNDDGSELIITLPRYGTANHVYRSMNATSASPTITSIQGVGAGKLPAMPVYSAAILAAPNSYLVGTDLGVWGTDDGGATWTELNNIGGPESQWHPRAAVLQIAVKPWLETDTGRHVGEIVYTGTYGRGTFMSTTRAPQLWPISTQNVSKSTSGLKVYPNPVTTTARVQYDAKQASKGMIKIYSLTGRMMNASYMQLQAGENEVKVDMSSYANGVYMVTITSTNGTMTGKIVKR